MKIRIEVEDSIAEDEVIIRCGRVDDTVRRIQEFVQEQSTQGPKLTFYKEGEAFYFPLDEVLFFETEKEQVYAHTAQDAFRIKFRLYELEDMLPRHFMRAAKSTILNLNKIYSIRRGITSASNLVQFSGTHKQVYISRRYYAAINLKLKERIQNEEG